MQPKKRIYSQRSYLDVFVSVSNWKLTGSDINEEEQIRK